MHILFLTPPLDGPATGGTLYNRQLIAALTAAQPHDLTFEQRTLEALPSAAPPAGVIGSPDSARTHGESSIECAPATNPPSAEARAGVTSGADSASLRGEAHLRSGKGAPAPIHPRAEAIERASGVSAADSASVRGEARAVSGRAAWTGVTGSSGLEPRVEQVWVDSLYLSALPDLRARFERETQLGLMLHYLPSLLGAPQLRAAAELSATELRALEAADVILTPSEYLRDLIAEICPGKRCVCVTPGVQVTQPGGASVRDGSALMICNVTDNKGVLPFLRELAQAVQPTATFELAIAGSLRLEAAYARECVTLCEQDEWLREHVRFLGSVSQQALFTRLAQASVLVSASRMESYGMALAEARALGTPILALPGGNIAHHVAAASGGQLAGTPRELADALCALMRNPTEQAARLTRARSAASIRPWSAAAADFAKLAIEARER